MVRNRRAKIDHRPPVGKLVLVKAGLAIADRAKVSRRRRAAMMSAVRVQVQVAQGQAPVVRGSVLLGKVGHRAKVGQVLVARVLAVPVVRESAVRSVVQVVQVVRVVLVLDPAEWEWVAATTGNGSSRMIRRCMPCSRPITRWNAEVWKFPTSYGNFRPSSGLKRKRS